MSIPRKNLNSPDTVDIGKGRSANKTWLEVRRFFVFRVRKSSRGSKHDGVSCTCTWCTVAHRVEFSAVSVTCHRIAIGESYRGRWFVTGKAARRWGPSASERRNYEPSVSSRERRETMPCHDRFRFSIRGGSTDGKLRDFYSRSSKHGSDSNTRHSRGSPPVLRRAFVRYRVEIVARVTKRSQFVFFYFPTYKEGKYRTISKRIFLWKYRFRDPVLQFFGTRAFTIAFHFSI